MRRAPGLYAAFGDGIACRKVSELLIGVLDMDDLRQPVADGALEGFLDLMLDDEDDCLESGAARIVNRVVNDELVVVSHRVNLLQSSVAASHARGHHNKNRFAHENHPLQSKC